MNAIEVRHVTKVYRRYVQRRQFATLKSALLTGSLIRDLQPDEMFPALQGVSFEVAKGTTFGIIGRNGSGKSTMLKLVAGIAKPTSGTLHVDGRISALIELGAGFHPEISGRENVFINGIMLGLSKKEVARRFDEIVEFAELRDFIDAPVKTYSSGMYMRLGFAVAINVNPDVLLVDEVLAVGDEAFTHKCLDKFGEFRRRGKTILLVTHSLSLVERLCDEALWLDGGKTQAIGDPRRVVDEYLTAIGHADERTLAAADAKAQEQAAVSVEAGLPSSREASAAFAPGFGGPTKLAERSRADRHSLGGGGQTPLLDAAPETPPDGLHALEGRWGSREVEIVDVVLRDREGQAGHVFQSGDPVSVHVKVRAKQPVNDFAFGVGLFNAEGVCCYGTNTYLEDLVPDALEGEGEIAFRIDTLDLVDGTYKLDVAVHKRDGYPYDYHRLLYTFRVKSRTPDVGIYRPRHRWTFSPNIRWRKDGPPHEQ